jgi:chemotaxis protein CheX
MGNSIIKPKLRLVLDERLARTCVNCVEKALAEMFGVQAQAGAWSVLNEYTAGGDVTGILSMVQLRLEANLVLSFDRETIFGVLSKLYRREFTEIDKSVQQGVGELTNIVYSMMKKALNEQGYTFQMAIPSVIFGEDHRVQTIHQGQTLVVPFTTDHGPFTVAVTIQGG